MRYIHYFGNSFFSNCLVYALIVFYKKGKYFLIRFNGIYMHFLVETISGNVVHMTTKKNREFGNRNFSLNRFLPFFGYSHIFKKKFLKKGSLIFKFKKKGLLYG